MAASGHTSEASSHRRFATRLLAIFGAVFLALGWAPSYREDWLLENMLVFILLPCVVFSYRSLPLSKLSYTALFLFLCLHEVGAHYTYSEVPYDVWSQAVLGRDFNSIVGWERNHFDRVVHFLWGLLLVYPVREVFLRVADAKGFWGYLFPLLVVMSTSLMFELIEWGAAVIFGGDLGMAYLGTQGDIWDSHKDSLLATVGALIASFVIAAVHATLDRDFTREWVESLTVKHHEPMGEVAIEHMLEEREHEGEK
jgi:putative membrane protein